MVFSLCQVSGVSQRPLMAQCRSSLRVQRRPRHGGARQTAASGRAMQGDAWKPRTGTGVDGRRGREGNGGTRRGRGTRQGAAGRTRCLHSGPRGGRSVEEASRGSQC
eukprot:2364357-Rhodomonas_salina.1